MTHRSTSPANALIGLVYLAVVVALAALCVALYRKDLPWQRGTEVSVITPSAGLQLNPRSDVKLNGLRVGEVTAITSDGRTATVRLRLDPDRAQLVPATVDATIVPTTLFGAKYVNLTLQPGYHARAITDGAVIHSSATAVEIGQLYTHLEAVLHTLRPDQLSPALGALAEALQGRGQRIGHTVALLNTYLRGVNPHVPTLLHDLDQLAPTARRYAAAAPDLITTLDNTSAASADLLVAHRAALSPLLRTTTSAADQLRELLDGSGDTITTLTSEARPVLALLGRYSPEFPCLIDTLNVTNTAVDHVVGGEGPYLSATVDAFTQLAPYTYPRDLPSNPDSPATNTRLPRGVPNWDPHCTVIPNQLRGLRDIGPYGARTRDLGAPGRPSHAESPTAHLAPTPSPPDGRDHGAGR